MCPALQLKYNSLHFDLTTIKKNTIPFPDWINFELLPISRLPLLLSFYPLAFLVFPYLRVHPWIHSANLHLPISYQRTNLSVHSLTHSLLPTPLFVLQEWQQTKPWITIDLEWLESRSPRSETQVSSELDAGQQSMGTCACCHWQETWFIITFLHHSPSQPFTIQHHRLLCDWED